MNLAINLEGLTKFYGRSKAVDSLSLKVKQGAFFGFLGPNGAGKTTTIRILTGILQADSGSVSVSGKTVSSEKSVLRGIGVLPESRGFYEWMTASEYLEFFANIYSVKDSKKVAYKKLSLVGLKDKKYSRISTFSRGMKQRLALARALINDPKVLFLDEPTLGLDPQGQEDVKNLLRQINASGVTIFLSSHLLDEVAELCSDLAIINRGRLIAAGTLAELRDEIKQPKANLKDIFLKLTNY